ncbi:hypothetical protein WMF45_19645 [Sorangium sp. So ce448]|uniref:hypothetical protein n=1 Tax=Sorangium sp. So ce448 TaxID=3133314 RepID=UPI003F5EB96F
MGTSPKPTTWIGLGAIAVAALAAAYSLGKISAESDKQPQWRQDAASKNNTVLQSTLSVARKRLASCEKTLQRRDDHPQKRDENPHADEDKPAPSPEPELSEQCIVKSQAKELYMMAENCRNFRWQFRAYNEILGSDMIDCETVLSIRELAQDQYSACSAVIRHFESASRPDAASDIRGIDAMESAYMFRSDYGDIDVDDLMKNPACIARMQAE